MVCGDMTAMAGIDNSFGDTSDHDHPLRSKFGERMDEFDAFLSDIVPELQPTGGTHGANNLLEGIVDSDCYLSEDGESERKKKNEMIRQKLLNHGGALERLLAPKPDPTESETKPQPVEAPQEIFIEPLKGGDEHETKNSDKQRSRPKSKDSKGRNSKSLSPRPPLTRNQGADGHSSGGRHKDPLSKSERSPFQPESEGDMDNLSSSDRARRNRPDGLGHRSEHGGRPRLRRDVLYSKSNRRLNVSTADSETAAATAVARRRNSSNASTPTSLSSSSRGARLRRKPDFNRQHSIADFRKQPSSRNLLQREDSSCGLRRTKGSSNDLRRSNGSSNDLRRTNGSSNDLRRTKGSSENLRRSNGSSNDLRRTKGSSENLRRTKGSSDNLRRSRRRDVLSQSMHHHGDSRNHTFSLQRGDRSLVANKLSPNSLLDSMGSNSNHLRRTMSSLETGGMVKSNSRNQMEGMYRTHGTGGGNSMLRVKSMMDAGGLGGMKKMTSRQSKTDIDDLLFNLKRENKKVAPAPMSRMGNAQW